MYRKKHNRLTARETCDIVRHIKPLGEVDFSGEIFFRHAVLSLRGAFCAEHLVKASQRRSLNLVRAIPVHLERASVSEART